MGFSNGLLSVKSRKDLKGVKETPLEIAIIFSSITETLSEIAFSPNSDVTLGFKISFIYFFR